MSRIKIYNTSDVEVFDVLMNENCEHIILAFNVMHVV